MVMNDSLIITKTKFSNLVGHQLHALNRTVRVITRAFKWLLFTAGKKRSWNFLCFGLKKSPIYHKFCLSYDSLVTELRVV